MEKLVSISFVDDQTINVVLNKDGENKLFVISGIENEQASISIVNEANKIKKFLNSSVLNKLDKSDTIQQIRANVLNDKIKQGIQEPKIPTIKEEE